MTDRYLRQHKEAVLGPIARAAPAGLHPLAITAAAFACGLGAALAAGAGGFALALGLWLANRALDGFDGTLARAHGRQSALGGYLDILMDVVVYAAIPLGVAWHDGSRGAFVAVAVLLASFYVNAISWAYLAALLERRDPGAAAGAELTSVTMPAGLIEGTETVVLFALVLAVPAWAPAIFWAMAAAVGFTALQRAAWAVRRLDAA